MKKFFLLVFTLLSVNIFAQNISDSLHVAHYDLQLDLSDFTTHTLHARADLSIVTRANALSSYVLDLQGLTVDSVFISNEPATFIHQSNKLSINHNSVMGDTVLVSVFYHGTPVHDTRWGGFYYSGEYCYNMGVAFDYQPHNFGRCWFPCLDVFTDKSTYTLHVHTQEGKMAVCGGTLTDSSTLADNSRVWTWQLELPIPSYLASVAVGPYKLYADTFHGAERIIPIEIYAQPNTIQNVAASFANIKPILRMYESLFGPYQWPRVGYVAVNFTSGAMEHATNIAYPNVAITGHDTYETLYAHELFHHWFGDLVTCARAEEMWINEGFASFSEPLITGLLHSTETQDAYLDYIRDVHHSTLKDIVKEDGGHYALDNVPQNVTYGTHSYDKGELVIHTLRHYLGDSLFFAACRSLLSAYAFKPLTSEQLFNHFSQVTGTDMTDFYEGWIHQPGFLHFSIDSITSLQGNNYRIYLHQKLLAAEHFANSNRIDLTFVSADRTMHTIHNATFSGEYGSVDVTLPFQPLFGIVDYFEHIADATIDYTKTLVSGNYWTPSDANCSVTLNSFSDSVLVRLEHNLVSADVPEALPDGISQMSNSHYWTVNIAGMQSENEQPQGSLKFKYQAAINTQLDYALIHGHTKDNVKLLYRATTADPWRIIHVTQSGNNSSGTLTTDFLGAGQYCLAIGEPTASIDTRSNEPQLRCIPNPAHHEIDLLWENHNGKVKANIYNAQGQLIRRVQLQCGHNHLILNDFANGVYFIKVKTKEGVTLTERIIVQ